ncbi:hypothetical protein SAMN05216319_1737 [Duganella sp. CF402]|uniref:hypothetical protein n=1 Tax=unclassified Duganella TaxID=2636909 RepID=UPI0008B30A00|nr:MULTISPECIES: hypothetical protein [unclassified Duganella]RZT09820.1 hypothetical protein EV582_1891 [Duganella sp. BK701]SEL41510.1 hypothetical protein SAMN05216319_1737 [Duganella sp. CF402]
MNSAIDKDYVDARIEGTFARLAGELKAHECIVVGLLDAHRQNLELGFKSFSEEVDAKFSRLESRLIKWLVNTALAGVVLNTLIVAALLQGETTQAQVAPVVIIIQP